MLSFVFTVSISRNSPESVGGEAGLWRPRIVKHFFFTFLDGEGIVHLLIFDLGSAFNVSLHNG